MAKEVKIVLCILILALVSCSESKRVFMKMNEEKSRGRVFTSEELFEKAVYFTNQRDYYDATYVIEDLINMYQKERNQEGIKKANALLCKIYQDKIDKNDTPGSVLNAFYRPDLAKISCQKAGIKMNQE